MREEGQEKKKRMCPVEQADTCVRERRARRVIEERSECRADMPGLIAAVQAAGDAIGLPYFVAQADLGDPEPMSDEAGRPYAETSFRWVDPDYAYWRDRKLALHIDRKSVV